jgi:hypothetical protein
MVSASIFNVNSASASVGLWKSTAVKTEDAADNVFQAKNSTTAAAADAVSVSKLGKELKGLAAEMFNHFDKKGKEVLEGLVNSGTMSAKEMVDGLAHMATRALYNRFQEERPRDPDRFKEVVARIDAARNMESKYMEEFGAVRYEFGKALDGIFARRESGAITEEQSLEEQRVAHVAMEEKTKVIDVKYPKDERESAGELTTFLINENIKENNDAFKTAVSTMKYGDELEKTMWLSGNEAMNKIGEVFLNQPGGKDEKTSMTVKAISSFADSIDLRPFGGKGPTLNPNNLTAEAASASAEASSLVAGSPAALPPASPAAAPPSAVSSTVASPSVASSSAVQGAAAGALSLLQSALERNATANRSPVAKAAADSKAADAGLASLMEALKSGVKPASPNIKINA